MTTADLSTIIKGHAKLSPSKADRWFACPGSIRLCAGLVDRPSRYALEGTHAHFVLEYCLKGNVDPANLVGASFGLAPKDFEVSQDMADAVGIAVAHVRALQAAHPELAWTYEGEANLRALHPDLWGSYDVQGATAFGHCIIIDYKHGQGVPVEADCLQMRIYALAAAWAFDAEQVTAIVIQPRAQHAAGPIRTKTYTREQLADFAQEVVAKAKATEAADAPLAAGDHCGWCLAAGTCPELRKATMEQARIDFSAPIAEARPPAPNTLTPAQVAQALALSDTIEAWIGAVRAMGYQMALAGAPPPGYKLIEGKAGNRRWTDETAVVEALQFLGVEPFDKSVRSPTDVEKELKKADFKALAHLVNRARGKVQLVPASDKRPALASPAEFPLEDPAAAE